MECEDFGYPFPDVIVLDDEGSFVEEDDHSDGDCQFISPSTFRVSKCSHSDLCSMESDCSDCEITMGEQWKDACLRRRMKPENVGEEYVSDDSCCTSQSGDGGEVDQKGREEAAGENHSFIVMGRENMKETEEYKRAVEEEWECRHRQLRIQAEEVRKLRRGIQKKRRADEMEKRQKLRVEEMRETQKKGEEEMDMKENIRGQVRSELGPIEKACRDMGTLLCCLGVRVGGDGPKFSHDEVHAAYKRALLRFHPDRAPRSDIAKLVEAEEKFKLICRMKEKLFLS